MPAGSVALNSAARPRTIGQDAIRWHRLLCDCQEWRESSFILASVCAARTEHARVLRFCAVDGQVLLQGYTRKFMGESRVKVGAWANAAPWINAAPQGP